MQTGGSSGTGDPLVGRTIGGSYVLQEIVGVGGMGRVYRAEQSTLGRTVAIKVIHPHLLGDEQTVARFYTEARASSRLNHPNSVSIIDFGRTDDGILFLAMEFLKGKDLALVMHEEGPLTFERVCDLLAAVLAAIMSTADSQVLTVAGSLAYDWQGNAADATRSPTTTRVVVMLVCIAAVALALYLPEDIFSRVLFAWHAVGSALGPVLVMRLIGREPGPGRTLAAMLTGFTLSVLLHAQPSAPGDCM